MATTHEVTDEELPQYIEFVTKDFYPRSVLVSSHHDCACVRVYVCYMSSLRVSIYVLIVFQHCQTQDEKQSGC